MFVWIFIYLIVFSTHALTREISIHTIPRTPRIRTKFKRIHFRPPKHARSVSPGSTTTAVIFPPIPERREDAQGPSQCRGAIGIAWGDTFRWTMYVYPFSHIAIPIFEATHRYVFLHSSYCITKAQGRRRSSRWPKYLQAGQSPPSTDLRLGFGPQPGSMNRLCTQLFQSWCPVRSLLRDILLRNVLRG